MNLYISIVCFLQANSSAQIADNSANHYGFIVFIAGLIFLLSLFFYFLNRTDKYVEEKEKERLAQLLINQVVIHDDPSDEAAAAIAMAISLYKAQLTEQENLTVTIQKVSKMYSPWSSKIYTLRQLPR